ncbi:galactan endo-1,6-beta-galactosidase [Kibdelosporangium banguiense]|uniref:Galactan endo-1,6-beta-galactosidase n=1 Tax=Kibdelosporangium banguiense TaxID=1365924 RepID=A0ABS4TVK5_9PSEU|nr:glycoside hydrolase [Kibdelosporangium banguiense]MBP2327956.1 galactan endo-1,6-beta-galactosidase [Kibdelosporangium banguiense]
MVTRRTLLSGAAAAVAGTTLATGTAHADMTVAVDPSADYGRWEGWGTSLAWWANVFGDRDDFADLWFTTKTVTYRGASLPGLGMNIARYNLGACSWNSVEGQAMAASPNIPRFKQIEGFWQDWRNEDPGSSAWNWSVDGKQRAALVKATQRGAMSELFANSPMWWMCLNHNPSGAADGGNNLQSWNYRQHAAHLAEVAKRAKDSWGVTFRTVDPFNEPSSDWWKAAGTQEGCHIDAGVQRTLLRHLRDELNKRGLTGTWISASDETNYDLARTTWNSFDSASKALVNQVNVHGYQGSGGRRDLLYQDVRAAGKVLWNSETGDADGTGLTMASNLCLDFRWLHPTAWVYWQVMDPTAGWALIHFDGNTLQAGNVQTKLYVLAQFTRHIRPGMRIIGTDAGNAVAAYDPAARRLVLVAVNTGSAQTITFNLTRFGTVPSTTITRWTTVTSGSGDRYTQRVDMRPDGKLLRVPFAAGAVQTLQIDGVVQ